eukprot:1403781-Amphidinium_carterae.1
MRSVARAFTLSGTVQLEDVEWHDGRRELFDQLLNDCACECERLDEGGRSLDGSVRAQPGLPEGGIPPLAISERVVMNVSDVHVSDDGLGPLPEVRVKAQPGRTDGAAPPQPPPRGHGRLAEFHSPQFGGTRALANETSGDGGGGGGGSGPSSSRGDPLHRKDPWHGATASTLSTGGIRTRAGGGGGEPEPSDDGGGSEESEDRRDQQLPDDVLRNFHNRMNRVNNDADSQGGDRPSGRGSRRRGHGGDGGDDGDDPDNPPSSSTSQAGDRYGPKRWHTAQKTKELELFKQRKTLPKLVLVQNWRTMQPAFVRQIFEDWKTKVVMTVGTWGHATHDVIEGRMNKARDEHEMWLDSSPTERARLEKQYLLGDSKAVSDPHNHFESVLRVELLEQIPDFMAQACTRQAIFDSVGIVSLVMRRMLPSHEFSRIGIAKDMMRMPQYALTTFATAAQWTESFLNRLAVAVKVGSMLEPRELHHVLHGALETILKDLDLGMTWQATSRDVQVRSAQFGEEDVQTL